MHRHVFQQIDVFTAVPLKGNALAVVHSADDLAIEQMQAFARWTNLSETTFLLKPTNAAADYRLRIFTPGGELPFAGHPTLGSCFAWLSKGGNSRDERHVMQECGVGLVKIRKEGARLAFAAPPLKRSGEVEPETLARIVNALRIERSAVRAAQWCDNGPGWVGILLSSRDEVLALQPHVSAMMDLNIGVIAPWPEGSIEAQYEVRAFCPSLGIPEDPVTGSLNAGLAQWLIGKGIAPERYVASQGTALQRAGRVFVAREGGEIWIGGDSVCCIDGHATL